ncbi:MAG TPA: hypothetical protein VN444_00145 [Verrucomicrobiae bacterium]|nr:hypothetical protein [Verrucomicrobiae bacterium]
MTDNKVAEQLQSVCDIVSRQTLPHRLCGPVPQLTYCTSPDTPLSVTGGVYDEHAGRSDSPFQPSGLRRAPCGWWVFHPEERVELVDGEIIMMALQSSRQ